MSNVIETYETLEEIVTTFRDSGKKYTLLFAHNGTGKTRLSMAFKDAGKNGGSSDTLYFNAFTEDLFSWNNDLDNDRERTLRINTDSRFFNGMQELELETRIGPLLERYADFNFFIDYENSIVRFMRGDDDHIKVSRGEENIFIWCFFLAVTQLAIDGQEAYDWVKYIYIDDPISSLDDNNVITVASHLVELLKSSNELKYVISTHHGLFYNVMFNELPNKAAKYLLTKEFESDSYVLQVLKNDTPFFQHIGILKELYRVAQEGTPYTYHFNLLRSVLEKAAAFHGFNKFSACIKEEDGDPEGIVHARRINILSHGNYSILEPSVMQEENKEHFKKILEGFLELYNFNSDLFTAQTTQTEASQS